LTVSPLVDSRVVIYEQSRVYIARRYVRRSDCNHKDAASTLADTCVTASHATAIGSVANLSRRETDAMKIVITSIDLAESARLRLIAVLNGQLACTSDLYSQTRQAHWNVKGAQFFALLELFERLADELEGVVDTIAERATALGGLTQGTVRLVAANLQLHEYPIDVTESKSTVKPLAERYAELAASTREAIKAAGAAGDEGTADLFTDVSRGLDTVLWFLKAHLQDKGCL
jgi:starvation-inducible DNA-binding protein